MVTQDSRQHLDSLGREMEERARRGDSHGERRLLKVMLRHGGCAAKTGRYPTLRNTDGRAAESAKEADSMVIEHFSKAEDAEIMLGDALIDKYNSRMHHEVGCVAVEPESL
eukprot:5239309-Pyramimonas_sp.AAC.1